jgi:hypothetical protein
VERRCRIPSSCNPSRRPSCRTSLREGLPLLRL